MRPSPREHRSTNSTRSLSSDQSGHHKTGTGTLRRECPTGLVVADQVAWLRTHENGQTKVGIVGSDSLLVAGTIEETAAAILAG